MARQRVSIHPLVAEFSKFRYNYNITAAQTARMFGVSQAYFSMIENGVKPLKEKSEIFKAMRKICCQSVSGSTLLE
jgi:predicted transcriptional regulator